MNKRLSPVEHKMRREFSKFQKGETAEQRKNLAEIMQAQENAKTLFNRIQINVDDVPYHGNDRLEKDMQGVQYYIKKYGENFLPGINTEKLKQIQKKIDATKEHNALIEAEDSFGRLKTNISGKFAGPFENQVAFLQGFIKQYGENLVPGVNTKNIEEMKKEMSVRKAKQNIDEIPNDITEGRWFAVQRKIDSLRKFIYAYRNENKPDMLGLTHEEIVEMGKRIKEMAIKSNEILGRVQTGRVRMIKKDCIFVSPDNGDYDIQIKNPEGQILEGDTVEFTIEKGGDVSLKEIVKA